MSDEQTTSPTQLLRAFDATVRDALQGAMRDYYAPLQGDETLADRCELIHDALWSALAHILVIHAQPHATRAATDAAILDYVAACIAQHGEPEAVAS
jgi:DNA-binding protein Fis